MIGLGGEGAVEGDDVGLLEELGEGDVFGRTFLCTGRSVGEERFECGEGVLTGWR